MQTWEQVIIGLILLAAVSLAVFAVIVAKQFIAQMEKEMRRETGPVPDYHWTDGHIIRGKTPTGEVYIAYDEAGLEHSRWPTREQARAALVEYEREVLNGLQNHN